MIALISIFISFCYILSFIFCILKFVKDLNTFKRLFLIFLLIGYGFHSFDVFNRLFRHEYMMFSQGEFYFNLLSWCFIFIYFILWWKFKTEFLALTISPISLIIYLSSFTINTNTLPYPYKMSVLWFVLHVSLLFFSIALMATAFGAGILYLYLDKQLKNKAKPTNFRKKIPSLIAIDSINHWTVLFGFPMFTIGSLAGFMWAGFTWGRFFSGDPKEIVTIIVWLLFAYLFHQRFALGWKGKKTSILAIWIFLLCVFSLLIVNFCFPTHHSFTKVLSGSYGI